ncbi:hypothetical protein PQX77_005005 [Marasmius sp. AFHP31]|nr:hypothetical protein PQX77_005005 [Marasmius sp. AFHP31]
MNDSWNNHRQYPLGLNKYQFYEIIAHATAEDLIRSGNEAFKNEHNQVIELKAQLSLLRSLGHPSTSSSERLDPPDSVPVLSPSLLDSRKKSLNEADISNCKFKHEQDWIQCIKESEKTTGKAPPKLGFLEDLAGQEISSGRRRELSNAANSVFSEMYGNWIDPDSWGSKAASVLEFFYVNMAAQFVEFRACEGMWKADKYAAAKYPDWCRDFRRAGKCQRMRPDPTSLKQAKEEPDIDNGLKPSRKRSRTVTAPPALAPDPAPMIPPERLAPQVVAVPPSSPVIAPAPSVTPAVSSSVSTASLIPPASPIQPPQPLSQVPLDPCRESDSPMPVVASRPSTPETCRGPMHSASLLRSPSMSTPPQRQRQHQVLPLPDITNVTPNTRSGLPAVESMRATPAPSNKQPVSQAPQKPLLNPLRNVVVVQPSTSSKPVTPLPSAPPAADKPGNNTPAPTTAASLVAVTTPQTTAVKKPRKPTKEPKQIPINDSNGPKNLFAKAYIAKHGESARFEEWEAEWKEISKDPIKFKVWKLQSSVVKREKKAGGDNKETSTSSGVV